MKSLPCCFPCVLDDLRAMAERMRLPQDVRERIEARARGYFGKELRLAEPSAHITAAHRILKEETGIAVPLSDFRRAVNDVGVALRERLRPKADALSGLDRFKFLCLWAVAGNHLDFRAAGIGYGFTVDQIEGMLSEVMSQGFALDQRDAICERAKAAKEILYVPDNVGELALDCLLVEELRSYGASVAVPYRGGAITSDAVLEDFRQVGMDASASRIFRAGPDTLGVSWEEASPELREAFSAADLVVAKGQANFYVVHEYAAEIPGAIACLLTTKCEPVSELFGLKGKVNVAAVVKAT